MFMQGRTRRPSEPPDPARLRATAQKGCKAHEAQSCQVRVELQRKRAGYGPQSKDTDEVLQARINSLRSKLESLDHKIGPLARASQELANPIWGVLMRAGNDKSHLAFQVERYADIYTSRVSNFLQATPFVYLRSPRGSLPHDPA